MTRTELTAEITEAIEAFDDKSEEDNRKLFWDIFQKVCEEGQHHIMDAEDYAEPGCSLDDEAMPILFADWNAETRWNHETGESETICDLMPQLGELAEQNGCSIEWSDQWDVCECRKAFRNSPDSYSWTQYGADLDGPVCGDCINEDPVEYLESISGQFNRAITIQGLDATEHGYTKVNSESYQNGLYGGQDASPAAIADCLNDNGITDFLFNIDSSGQFDLRFSVFVKSEDHEDAVASLSTGNTRCDVDPAVALDRGLKAASKAMSELDPADGIKYAKVNADGTATVRSLTPEEFIAGVQD